MGGDEKHEPVERIVVPGGIRFTCWQCGASVSVPMDLVRAWEKADRLDAEVQPRLTRTLLLRHHTGRMFKWQS